MNQVSSWTTVELELTGRCQLECLHCYAESSPLGDHGIMTEAHWIDVVDQAAAMNFTAVQLIGGEPTLSPAFEPVLRHAVNSGLRVEVYTNFFHVREHWWELFSLEGVSLATSYYSDQAVQHDAMTTRIGSHQRTTANIQEALARGIPVRVGLVELPTGKPTKAMEKLTTLGVTSIHADRLRAVGRTSRGASDPSELCGACGRGKAAVSPAGAVWPCVMSRWMIAGNVLEEPLADILTGPRWQELTTSITGGKNEPNCNPKQCDPVVNDGDDCSPAHTPACNLKFCNPDTKKK